MLTCFTLEVTACCLQRQAGAAGVSFRLSFLYFVIVLGSDGEQITLQELNLSSVGLLAASTYKKGPKMQF